MKFKPLAFYLLIIFSFACGGENITEIVDHSTDSQNPTNNTGNTGSTPQLPLPPTETPQPTEPPTIELPTNFETLSRVTDHLSVIQNDDGSFGWQRDLSQPWETTNPGFQNVTGIPGLAILALNNLEAHDVWRAALDQVAVYLDGRLTLLINDPGFSDNNLSCSNWIFLVRYLNRFPNETLRSRLISAINVLLDRRNIDFGNNPNIRVDGIFNRTIQGRNSIPGIIPWDMASCVVALNEMAHLDAAFSADASDSMAIMVDYINTIFLPAYDANPQRSYNDISLGLPLAVIARLASEQTTLIEALTLRLLPLTDNQGRISNRPITYPPIQSTAYGLMGLKAAGRSEEAARSQAFLESQIREDGVIAFPNENTETFLVEAEVILALVQETGF